MKLLYTPTSPYARKVLILAIESGIDSQIERVNMNPWPEDSSVPEYNPLGKVPALVRDSGPILFDSPVICEYLDGLSSSPRFFPQGEDRWRALRMQAIADGMLDASVLWRLEAMRPQDKQHAPWSDRQLTVIRQGLAALEHEADALNEPISIAHIAVGCALGYLDFRLGDEDWRTPHPRLASWFATWVERPSMKATEPPSG